MHEYIYIYILCIFIHIYIYIHTLYIIYIHTLYIIYIYICPYMSHLQLVGYVFFYPNEPIKNDPSRACWTSHIFLEALDLGTLLVLKSQGPQGTISAVLFRGDRNVEMNLVQVNPSSGSIIMIRYHHLMFVLPFYPLVIQQKALENHHF